MSWNLHYFGPLQWHDWHNTSNQDAVGLSIDFTELSCTQKRNKRLGKEDALLMHKNDC